MIAIARTLLVAGFLAHRLAAQGIPAADSLFANGAWAPALKLYQQALPTQPTNLAGHVRAGYAALALRQVDLAGPYFKLVVDAAPPNGAPAAKAGLSMVAARKGDRGGAIELLEQAVKVGYANVELIDQEPGYAPLGKDPRFIAARGRAEANAYPCLADPAARVFDFWIGDWDVYVTGTAQRAGSNRIERIAGGCALLENWTAWVTPLAGPSDGKSMNFIDPATGLWRQVWMGSGRGQNNFENGKLVDGAMRFEFSRPNAQGQPTVGRFVFFNLGPNRVRQFQESSTDGGASYTTNYDLTYIRRGSGEPPIAR